LLIGVALASSRSVLEPAGIGSVGQRGSFWRLPPLHPPPYQNLAKQTRYRWCESLEPCSAPCALNPTSPGCGALQSRRLPVTLQVSGRVEEVMLAGRCVEVVVREDCHSGNSCCKVTSFAKLGAWSGRI